uniref:Uncharacterized protein n=1 Tax=Monopterus albus TaxID=43700 RepID=A0A3Q3JN41_MONAL
MAKLHSPTLRHKHRRAIFEEVGDILHHIACRSENAQAVLDLLSEYPLQCLLVAEEALWCNVIQQAFEESSPVKSSNLKAYNSAKLKNLGCFIRDGVTGTRSESLVSKYMMMCLRALVQLTMNHAQQLSQLMEAQCVLESSFEWLRLMKYHIISEDQSLKGSDNPTYLYGVHCPLWLHLQRPPQTMAGPSLQVFCLKLVVE